MPYALPICAKEYPSDINETYKCLKAELLVFLLKYTSLFI